MYLIISPNVFPMTPEQSETLGPLTYIALLVGPSVAGILLIGVADGKAGYRDLSSRLFNWRVGFRWYLFVLLFAPLLASAVLLILSMFSSEFMPALLTSDDKFSLLMSGIMSGIMVGIFEELGWTGFAVPRLRLRYGVLATGIIVGLIWGAWHFLPFWEIDTFAGAFPLILLIMRLFSWLPPFRTLMVWVHDKTNSLLMVILMHASLVFTTLAIPSPELSGNSILIWLIVWATALWGVALIVAKRDNYL
ncbi:MAG: hypothetical protein CW716_12795 [Candidatus Bathyarchaeum sp.]|nr:MAG: hypothetical protein CW716_12795 [Candidatus Bathyarchaeum sp.]